MSVYSPILEISRRDTSYVQANLNDILITSSLQDHNFEPVSTITAATKFRQQQKHPSKGALMKRCSENCSKFTENTHAEV